MQAQFVLEQGMNWKQAITWLISFSALLGPIAGIMISDLSSWKKSRRT
jgi:cytosine/uracil/thiamine/allantoin permease